MSVKKWIAICILFIAGASVLAHGVLPHVYHDNAICLSVNHASHCDANDNSTGHDHTKTGTNHNQDHSESCPLKDSVLRQLDNNSHNLVPLILLAVHHACGLAGCHIEEPPVFVFSVQKPYLESYYTQYVVPTLGLRAPPRI